MTTSNLPRWRTSRPWQKVAGIMQVAAMSAWLASPLSAQYVPDGFGYPVWTSPDPEPPEGPDWGDNDSDSLPNWWESYLGSDPYTADTDGDGLSDFTEALVYPTFSPTSSDTDNDSTGDLVEYLITYYPYD